MPGVGLRGCHVPPAEVVSRPVPLAVRRLEVNWRIVIGWPAGSPAPVVRDAGVGRDPAPVSITGAAALPAVRRVLGRPRIQPTFRPNRQTGGQGEKNPPNVDLGVAEGPPGDNGGVDFSAYRHGFVRVAACTHRTALADPAANAASVLPGSPASATTRAWQWRCSRS